MTLVELLVTMVITSILALVVGALFTGLSKTVSFTGGTTDTTAYARVTMQAMTETLRAAVPSGVDVVALTEAKVDTMTFYASLDRTGGTSTTRVAPSLVTFAWNGSDCITRTVNNGSTTQTSCLMRTTTPPVFSYYDTATATTALTIPTGGISLPVRHTLDAVGITLNGTKATSAGRAATSQVEDRVTLANCLTSAC